MPLAVKTCGFVGPSAKNFFRDIFEAHWHYSWPEGFYFAQQISILLQRGDAGSLLETFPSGIDALGPYKCSFYT